jgi:hypothetical protein
MAVKKCVVSFKHGFRHSVEVDAENLHEVATVAAKRFQDHGYPLGLASELAIEVNAPAVFHTVSLKRVQAWVIPAQKVPRIGCLRND